MLGVGQKFPEFDLTATVSLDRKNAFKQLTNKDFGFRESDTPANRAAAVARLRAYVNSSRTAGGP